jgi:prolyl-tRNA synthetase
MEKEKKNEAKHHAKTEGQKQHAEIKHGVPGEKKQTLGLTVKKDEDFSEWYTQVIQKAELADYTAVSGCIVFRPYSYAIWEKLQKFLDDNFKKSGVKNAYFPMFIPESLLTKEKEHVEGFTPEVAWVTHAGDSKLAERLAIRPTSETIMYDSYSKWIRSHNDLPLRINQWCSVVRWEFKYAVPFMRNREFLWQEGHTVFATKEEAEKEVLEMLDYYARAYEELLAVPVIKGKKTEKEKFAGAVYTTTIESFMPTKKALQSATSHFLGQNFSKAFNINFLDKEGKKQFGWQNSWGFSTRSIGGMIIMHGDDKGLVLPPNIAPIQVVIIPILFDKTKEQVMKKAEELKKELSEHVSVLLDDRENYSPGFKFNEWELKGVPIRIEIGPRDIESGHVVMARRDTSEKITVKFADMKKKVESLLEEIQENLFKKAKKQMEDSMVFVEDWKQFLKAVEDKKYIKALHCGIVECETEMKDKTEGVKATCIPFDQPKHIKGKCVHCGKEAKYEVLFARSY